jgi:hypothetical protein
MLAGDEDDSITLKNPKMDVKGKIIRLRRDEDRIWVKQTTKVGTKSKVKVTPIPWGDIEAINGEPVGPAPREKAPAPMPKADG